LAEIIDPKPIVQITRCPIHPLLAPFPIACFVGVLLTDITYAVTAETMWADFSAWLITVGVITGVLAAIAAIIDFATNRLVRERMPAWPQVIAGIAALVLAFFNALAHTRDAWTSVVPTGLILSVIVVLILPFTGWWGLTIVYRRHLGAVK